MTRPKGLKTRDVLLREVSQSFGLQNAPRLYILLLAATQNLHALQRYAYRNSHFMVPALSCSLGLNTLSYRIRFRHTVAKHVDSE